MGRAGWRARLQIRELAHATGSTLAIEKHSVMFCPNSAQGRFL